MAATRTVHRGSRGRFAGASGGKAEKIRVGRGYSRAATANNARPPTKGSARRSRIKSLAVKAAKTKTAKTIGTAAVATGVSIGAGALASRVLSSRPSGVKKATTYSGLGVGRRERVSMPNTPLRGDAVVGGRSVKNGAFVSGPSTRTASRVSGTKVNYSTGVGRREYVGRRLKPGEGYGFKLKMG